MILNILGKAARVIGLQRRGERLGAVVDRLGRFQNFHRGLFHALDGGAEIAGRVREPALAVVADERGKLALVAGDGVVQEGELAPERFAAIGRVGSVGRRTRRLGARELIVCRSACGCAAMRPSNMRSMRKTLRCTSCPRNQPICFYRSGD